MTFELKALSPDAVPRALAKAERYRLLNEPGEAASICLDALAADSENQEALITLLLALTDQFDDDALLRWNTCARLIMHDRRLVPATEDRGEPLLLE